MFSSLLLVPLVLAGLVVLLVMVLLERRDPTGRRPYAIDLSW